MWIALERGSQLTLARQIYQQIRQMILSEAIESGHKLPSTRRLSSDLSVSRNTVIEAYSQLIAEGYLKTYNGSGTVVAEGLRALDITISPNRSSVSKQDKTQLADEMIDFRTGIPALEYFPRKEWGDLYREVCSKISVSAFGYCMSAGIWELREAIAQYLYRARGLPCDPNQIIITSGSTQGLSLISHILQDNQKVVLMEDPTHVGLRKVITSAGCLVDSVPVDDNGLCTELLDIKKKVSFIYTTPSHQYPTGSILPIQRRLELVRYAEQTDCYIVEDDYDSEFRYDGQPVSSLYELNPQRVIYLGSFSKILAPALRLGFMVLPQKLFSPCRKLKMYSDVHSDAIGQYTLAQFIQNGGFEKHIWKMKKQYSRKRSFMLGELSKHFLNEFDVLGNATGLHLAMQFHNKTFTWKIVNEIADNGVRIYPIGNYYIKEEPKHNNGIVLGYSHLPADKVKRGIEVIRNVIS